MKFPSWLKGGLAGICLLIIYLIYLFFTTTAQEPPNKLIQVLELGIFLIIPIFALGSVAGLIIGLMLKRNNRK
ncbi:MAG: hypothetical protein PHF67_01310 [Candidatus Nanoarchaeia archaeon]|nr:hypothetical protein [Candidatus Nanoarchaeia archaeon]